jgi:hypothetical protein
VRGLDIGAITGNCRGHRDHRHDQEQDGRTIKTPSLPRAGHTDAATR